MSESDLPLQTLDSEIKCLTISKHFKNEIGTELPIVFLEVIGGPPEFPTKIPSFIAPNCPVSPRIQFIDLARFANYCAFFYGLNHSLSVIAELPHP